MKVNKWVIEVRDSYSINGQEIVKTNSIVIPPTNGNRTDIIEENGMYHFGMTKEEFMGRLTKEEYLEQTMPMIRFDDKEEEKKFKKAREKSLKEMSWTPRRRKGEIAIIIEIKKGEVTLKGK